MDTDIQPIHCGGLTFHLAAREVDGKPVLTITADQDADPLRALTFRADVGESSIEAATHGLCLTTAHLSEGLTAALRHTNGWTAAVREYEGRQAVVTVRHALGFRDLEFSLTLHADDLSVEDRLERLARLVGSCTNDAFHDLPDHDTSANLDLFHNGLGVVNARSSHRCSNSVTTGVQYREGQHYLEFRVVRCARRDCLLGVQEEPAGLRSSLTRPRFPCGKAIHAYSGDLCHEDTVTPYGLGGFEAGDYVGVLLDMEERQVTFSVNGRNGQPQRLPGHAYYFTASIFSMGDSVELLPQYCWHKY